MLLRKFTDFPATAASSSLSTKAQQFLLWNSLHSVFRNVKAPKLVPHSIKSQKHIERCTEIIDYIDNHYMEPHFIRNAGRCFFTLKEHLSRTFKTYMDTTFKKYLTSIRVHHAYQDLMDTDLSILQIALDTVFRCTGLLQCFLQLLWRNTSQIPKKQ